MNNKKGFSDLFDIVVLVLIFLFLIVLYSACDYQKRNTYAYLRAKESLTQQEKVELYKIEYDLMTTRKHDGISTGVAIGLASGATAAARR